MKELLRAAPRRSEVERPVKDTLSLERPPRRVNRGTEAGQGKVRFLPVTQCSLRRILYLEARATPMTRSCVGGTASKAGRYGQRSHYGSRGKPESLTPPGVGAMPQRCRTALRNVCL